ncbi:MAG: hypothetical protein MHM6MM_007460 [Cercozoa sp. M6MM]
MQSHVDNPVRDLCSLLTRPEPSTVPDELVDQLEVQMQNTPHKDVRFYRDEAVREYMAALSPKLRALQHDGDDSEVLQSLVDAYPKMSLFANTLASACERVLGRVNHRDHVLLVMKQALQDSGTINAVGLAEAIERQIKTAAELAENNDQEDSQLVEKRVRDTIECLKQLGMDRVVCNDVEVALKQAMLEATKAHQPYLMAAMRGTLPMRSLEHVLGVQANVTQNVSG